MTEPYRPPSEYLLLPSQNMDQEHKDRKKAVVVTTCALAALLVLAGVVLTIALTVAKKDNQFANIKNNCPVTLPATLTVGDKGSSLMLDSAGGSLHQQTDMETLVCVLAAVKTPDAVINRMAHTNALAGQQEASWDGYTAHWTYHPDNGLDLILEK